MSGTSCFCVDTTAIPGRGGEVTFPCASVGTPQLSSHLETAGTDKDLEGLLARVDAGDHAAFHHLFEREAPRLFAIALRIAGHERPAGDVLTTMFAQIWRRAVRYSPQMGPPEGWLIALLRSHAMELVARQQQEGAPFEIFNRNADIDPALARLSATAEGVRMAAALSHLESPRCDMIVMAFLDGMPLVDIAQKLRLPIGTVKNSIRRSLASLRTTLEPAA